MSTALAIGLAVFSTTVVMHYLRVMHQHLVEHFDRDIFQLQEQMHMSQQDAVDAVVAELGKAKTEIVGKIADLQAQIDAGVPAEQLDLSALTAAAQALDDVVPDAPAPVVDPVPPVEPPVS